MLDTVALGQVCGGHSGTGTGLWWTPWHWNRFVVATVALGQVCGGHCGTGTGLWWTLWHWDRFVVDTVALGQVSPANISVFPPVSVIPSTLGTLPFVYHRRCTTLAVTASLNKHSEK